MVYNDLRPDTDRDDSCVVIAIQIFPGIKIGKLIFPESQGEKFTIKYKESGTKTTDGDLVNCFQLQNNLFMTMMSTNTIMSDMYFTDTAVNRSTIGILRCCCPAYDNEDENLKFVYGYESKTKEE